MTQRWRAAVHLSRWIRLLRVAGRLSRVEWEWSWERQARLEQVAAGARAAITALVAVTLLLGWIGSDERTWAAWGAMATFVALDMLFRRRHAERPPRFRGGSALADLILYAAMVSTTGGPHSPLLWLLAFGLVWQSHRLEPCLSLPITAAYIAVFIAVRGLAPATLIHATVLLVLGTFLALGSARRAELHRRSLRDTMTGCFSRAYGLFALHELVAGGAFPFSLLFLDLDYFKRVNDTLGHEVGDQVLTQAARAISAAVRATDMVIRHGGDEFLVLLAGVDIDAAGKLAECVRNRLRQSTAVALAPYGDLPVTFSCGVVEAHPGQNVDDLLKAADRRLYEAKRQRDCIVGAVLGA